MSKRSNLKDIPDITSLAELIFLLDGYRINRFESPQAIERTVEKGALGQEIAGKWRNIRSNLDEMASVPGSIPGVVRLTKIRIGFRFLASTYTLLALMLVVARFILHEDYGQWGTWLVISTVAVVPTAWIIAELANYRIAKRVEEFFGKHPQSLEKIRSDLKRTVQSLIFSLFHQIRRSGKDPKRQAFRIYNVDYEGIEVVQRPSRWVKYYLVSAKS